MRWVFILMLATRALFTGSLPDAPPKAADFLLVEDAGWNWPQDPKFLYHDGKTYFGWSDSEGKLWIAAYVHATETRTQPALLHDFGVQDIHYGVGIIVRASDERLVIAYAGHESDDIYVRISTNPADEQSWGSEIALDSTLGGNLYTYAGLVQLTGEADDPIYLFFRDKPDIGHGSPFYLNYAKSTDGGATWSAKTRLLTPDDGLPEGHTNYRRVTTNGTDRIDLLVTNTSRRVDYPNGLYHLYWYDGEWRTSDGSAITGGKPWDKSKLTEVKAAITGKYMNPDGLSYDTEGNPVAVYHIYQPSTDSALVMYTAWNGSAWVESEVTDTGAVYPTGRSFNTNAAIDHALAGSTIWCSKAVDGVLEIWRFTDDDGWSGYQLTHDSEHHNIQLDTVWGGQSDLRLIWHTGVYTSQHDWQMDMRGRRGS